MNYLFGLIAGLFISGYLTILFVISGSEQTDKSGGKNFAAAISIILATMFFIFNKNLNLQHPWQPYLSISMVVGSLIWVNIHHSKATP